LLSALPCLALNFSGASCRPVLFFTYISLISPWDQRPGSNHLFITKNKTMSDQKVFEASPESVAKAKQLRIIAFVAWILAMAGQVFAIFNLISNDMLVWLIVAIVVILALAITGSVLWKKANRLDPASEADKTKFFIQNQLV
jgi:hypothetical protein